MKYTTIVSLISFQANLYMNLPTVWLGTVCKGIVFGQRNRNGLKQVYFLGKAKDRTTLLHHISSQSLQGTGMPM